MVCKAVQNKRIYHLPNFKSRTKSVQTKFLIIYVLKISCVQVIQDNWVICWWAQTDLNRRPSDYESPALTAELWAQSGSYCAWASFVSKLIPP